MKWTQKAIDAGYDLVRFTVAVLIFEWWRPFINGLIPHAPIVVNLLTGMLSAGATLIVAWILFSRSSVVVTMYSVSTLTAVPGDTLTFESKGSGKSRTLYDFKITYSGTGLLAKRIANSIIDRGLTLTLTIKSPYAALYRENGAGIQIRDDIQIAMDAVITDAVWASTVVSIEARDLPRVPETAKLDYKLDLGDGHGLAWYHRIFIRTRPTITKLLLTRK